MHARLKSVHNNECDRTVLRERMKNVDEGIIYLTPPSVGNVGAPLGVGVLETSVLLDGKVSLHQVLSPIPACPLPGS